LSLLFVLDLLRGRPCPDPHPPVTVHFSVSIHGSWHTANGGQSKQLQQTVYPDVVSTKHAVAFCLLSEHTTTLRSELTSTMTSLLQLLV